MIIAPACFTSSFILSQLLTTHMRLSLQEVASLIPDHPTCFKLPRNMRLRLFNDALIRVERRSISKKQEGCCCLMSPGKLWKPKTSETWSETTSVMLRSYPWPETCQCQQCLWSVSAHLAHHHRHNHHYHWWLAKMLWIHSKGLNFLKLSPLSHGVNPEQLISWPPPGSGLWSVTLLWPVSHLKHPRLMTF